MADLDKFPDGATGLFIQTAFSKIVDALRFTRRPWTLEFTGDKCTYNGKEWNLSPNFGADREDIPGTNNSWVEVNNAAITAAAPGTIAPWVAGNTRTTVTQFYAGKVWVFKRKPAGSASIDPASTLAGTNRGSYNWYIDEGLFEWSEPVSDYINPGQIVYFEGRLYRNLQNPQIEPTPNTDTDWVDLIQDVIGGAAPPTGNNTGGITLVSIVMKTNHSGTFNSSLELNTGYTTTPVWKLAGDADQATLNYSKVFPDTSEKTITLTVQTGSLKTLPLAYRNISEITFIGTEGLEEIDLRNDAGAALTNGELNSMNNIKVLRLANTASQVDTSLANKDLRILDIGNCTLSAPDDNSLTATTALEEISQQGSGSTITPGKLSQYGSLRKIVSHQIGAFNDTHCQSWPNATDLRIGYNGATVVNNVGIAGMSGLQTLELPDTGGTITGGGLVPLTELTRVDLSGHADVDGVCIALSDHGKINGTLIMQSTSPVPNNSSLSARQNLDARGWSLNLNT